MAKKAPVLSERLASLQAKTKAVEAEIKAVEQKRLASLGSVVASLLSSDAELRAALLPKLQAVTSPRVKAEIAEFLIT